MNFERFNPLAIFANDPKQNDKHNDPIFQPPGISDWGIEETSSNAGSSLHYAPSFNANHIHGLNSSTLFNEDRDFGYYYQKYSHSPIPPTTDNFSKYIKKYLGLRSHQEFWERFKYNLIVSNLLDDTMILSKNDQLLNAMISSQQKKSAALSTLVTTLNNDGTELILDSRRYKLKFPHVLCTKNHIFIVINIIITLLKRSIDGSVDRAAQFKAFKIVLIVATKVIKYKRANSLIQQGKIINLLDNFLINNFKINKKLISNLITLKEMELFNFMNKDNQAPKRNVAHLKSHLNSSLDFLLFNLRSSIIKLLPVLSGPVFEKYCNINNIDIFAFYGDEPEEDSSEITIQKIVGKINKFNKLRKFMVCQILTIDEKTEKNFFLLKIFDLFDLNDYEEEIDELQNLTVFEKLMILEEFFVDHNKVLANFDLLFERFEKLNKFNNLSVKDEDILKETVAESVDDTNLDHMIQNISKLLTNLRFFKKYNQSTLNNLDELNEKMFIFDQFKDELSSIQQLYNLNVQDLKYQSAPSDTDTAPPSAGSSARTSRTSGEFNLKSFHTMNSSTIKKRYSLPPKPAQTSPSLSLKDARRTSDEPKRDSYNRLSTGLKLGLLTVFEEEPKPHPMGLKKPISFDDNYINILPPANYYNDTYNQAALDMLSKKNRFSVNSFTSSTSDFLTSTQATSFEEEDINHLSKDELRLKLEESLNRIYTLEKQGDPQIAEDSKPSSTEDLNDVGQDTISKSFLNDLEATLTSRQTTT